MSDTEQPEHDPQAWAARTEAGGGGDEVEIRITTFDSPGIPADRLEHDRGEEYWTGTGINPERASEWEHRPPSWRPAEPEQRNGRIARQARPVPPGDRLAHLGHIEHPTELYTIMKPVPNTLPAPPDAEEWIASFGQVVADGNLPGGDGKTSSRAMILDLDPQGAAATPLGGHGVDLCRTCLAPATKASPKCTNPFNHQESAR
ncbi:hypothetical protein AB0I69_42485 [Streptomyces sp. NPDC050508]|uniref:hypothetical protein n=1 Tax=Streptomyces sp. NPDC050508 TaxID=3155405 RepID=UPI00343A8CF9